MGLKKYVFGKHKKFPSRNLIAYYKFDGNSIDSTLNNHNGVDSSVVYQTIGAIIGQSCRFPNASSWVNIPTSSDFSFTDNTNDLPFSMSMWLTFASLPTTTNGSTGSMFINKRNATSGGDEWQLLILSGSLQFWKFDKSNNSITKIVRTIGVPFNTFEFYHLVVTDGIGGLKIYINNVLQTTILDVSVGYTSMLNSSSNVRLGFPAWDNFTPQYRFNGWMDELGIWKNRELSIDEVSTLYNNGSGLKY